MAVLQEHRACMQCRVVPRECFRQTCRQPSTLTWLTDQKSEDLMKPCLECAHQSDIYKKFTQACKDAGFQVTSGAGAITVSLGAVAAGAALAAWF